MLLKFQIYFRLRHTNRLSAFKFNEDYVKISKAHNFVGFIYFHHVLHKDGAYQQLADVFSGL